MPYKSEAQRRKFHADPKLRPLARKWDREEKVKKNATVTPIFKSADPYFNAEAAQRAYDAVMKMDDDSAYMFTHLLMKDVLADDIEANQRTLQRRINQVVEKRIDRLRKATMAAVSKSHSQEAVEFAKALDAIEKAYKNPYATGAYQFKESDFRRDPTTGQFRTKVRVNPNMRPLSPKQAQNLGIPQTKKYTDMSPQKKAQFQQEWMQIANFLNAAGETSGSGLGDHDVELNIRDASGNHYVRRVNGKPRLGADWDPALGERVVSVSATPGDLRLGGVAFGLGNALGQAPRRTTVGGVNRFDENFDQFAEDFTTVPDDARTSSNARLYNRVNESAKFVSEVAPNTAIKTQMAARFARAVGEHGPQAEKILGPGARKLAYRYRGTEKTPDSSAVKEFRAATGSNLGELTPEQNKQMERAKESAVKRYRGNKASNQGIPVEAIKLNADEIAQVRRGAERRWREDRNLLPQEVGLSEEARVNGRIALARWLMDDKKNPKAPKKDLYNLQMEAGNTPASQGFIIDAQGKIVTQAQGYGDDHYVPFNLKNLKGLEGGEYIRSRSVGGPTAEDIYTGLATGARRVTVVSRSGYFTVEFNPETTKGRFNDKAKRMVGRYEKILDAVQSEKVDRPVRVDPKIQEFYSQRVKELYPGATPRQQHQYTKAMINDYKRSLQMTEGDKAEFEVKVAEETQGLPEERANRVRAQMMNNWRSDNEYLFRLNGRGYEDALRSLEEQFPYYITTHAGPLHEQEQITTEHDKGYVEPGRNRPTEAKAGLFGTAERLGGFGNDAGGKFSASQADYQGYGKPRRERGPEQRPETPGTTPQQTNGQTTAATGLAALHAERSQELSQQSQRRRIQTVQDKGLELTRALQEDMKWHEMGGIENAAKVLPPLGMQADDQILDWFSKPENIRDADEKLAGLEIKSGALTERLRTTMKAYADASGKLNRVGFDKKLMFQEPKQPFLFNEDAYQEDADPSLAESEARRIDAETKPVSIGGGSYSTMSQEELVNEIRVLSKIHRGLDEINRTYAKDDLPGRAQELERLGVNVSIPGVMQILEKDDLDLHAENAQRMMALNLNRGERHTGRTLELPTERTEHLEPPPPGNKEIARFHAEQLTNAITKLTDGVDWTTDDPRLEVARQLGSHAKRYKEASQGMEISNASLAEMNDQARDALILARAIKENKGDINELARKYRDDNRL